MGHPGSAGSRGEWSGPASSAHESTREIGVIRKHDSKSPRPHDMLVPELRPHDNGFHHRIEPIAVRCQVALHGIDQRFVGELQRAIERVNKQLAAKVVEELVLPMRKPSLTSRPNPRAAIEAGHRSRQDSSRACWPACGVLAY
jgi:hypothetical protein